MSTTKSIDVRPIAPRERHPLLFQTFDDLAAGESFELVNDLRSCRSITSSWPSVRVSWGGSTWKRVLRPGAWC
ncbi:MAG: DUF2249 domain-containing protein [Thermomicrobiales bacterium]|nr:DUF2249 domain-containing protein [Thermomicrobiales bacterium]